MGLNTRDLRVLVVEDNQHFRLLIRTVLQALGVKAIEEAENGADALDRLGSHTVDLVILDWRMEPMDGLEFAWAIRHDPASPDPYLPMIMITGHADPALVAKARDYGINEFLAKPISAKTLMARVLAVLQKPKPYVRTNDYFGPDRRRRQLAHAGEERRRTPATFVAPVKPAGETG